MGVTRLRWAYGAATRFGWPQSGRQRVGRCYRRFMTTIPGYDRITVERGKLGGKPCIRGMRISVSRVLDILATYKSRQEIRVDFPDLEDEDLEQALRFAAENL